MWLSLDRVADAGGGKVIVVDADNDGLVGFYRRAGVKPTGAEDDLALYMKGGLTPVLGHAESSICCWGSEMIQNYGQEELLRGVSSSGRRLV